MIEREDHELISRNPKVFSGHIKTCSYCKEEFPTSVYNGPLAKRDFDGQPALLMVRPKGMMHYYFCPGQRSQEQLDRTWHKVKTNQKNFSEERKLMLQEGIRVPLMHDIISRLKTKNMWLDLREESQEPDKPQEHFIDKPSGYPTPTKHNPDKYDQPNTPPGLRGIVEVDIQKLQGTDATKRVELFDRDIAQSATIGYAKAPVFKEKDFQTAEDILNKNMYRMIEGIAKEVNAIYRFLRVPETFRE